MIRMKKVLILSAFASLFASCALAQGTLLICESRYNNTYPVFAAEVDPSHVHENYVATLELDLGSQSLVSLSGDWTFGLFGTWIGCDDPAWTVQSSTNEIKISADSFQCGELSPSGTSWLMVINRVTGDFYRGWGNMFTGPFTYSEGVCASARQRF